MVDSCCEKESSRRKYFSMYDSFHHFTISEFHHFEISSLYHFTILSTQSFLLHYLISISLTWHKNSYYWYHLDPIERTFNVFWSLTSFEHKTFSLCQYIFSNNTAKFHASGPILPYRNHFPPSLKTLNIPTVFVVTSGHQMFLPSKIVFGWLRIQVLKTFRLVAICIPLAPWI